MMTQFDAWDEVIQILEDIKQRKVLDDPEDWLTCFQEVVETAKYIDQASDVVEFLSAIFSAAGWLNVSDIVTGAGGAKSVPAVTNIITDLTTGEAIAGQSALAAEALGTTVELSVASFLGIATIGMGLGCLAYEAQPQFWCDLSNYVFEPITGEHVTPENAEPFLRSTIRHLMTAEDGKIVTYADEDLLSRVYDFYKQHIAGTGNYDFLDGVTWRTNSDTLNPTPTLDVNKQAPASVPVTAFVKSSLNDEIINQFGIQAFRYAKNVIGFTPVGAADLSGIFNDLRYSYPQYNNCNVYQMYITFMCDPNDEENPYLYYYFIINGFRVPTDEHGNIEGSLRQDRWYTYIYPPTFADDWGYELDLTGVNYRTPVFSYRRDVKNEITSIKDDGTAYHEIDNFGLGYCGEFIGHYPTNNNKSVQISTSNLGSESDTVLDEYLTGKGVTKNGKTPLPERSLVDGYKDWVKNTKVVSQPDKNGAAKQTTQVPTTLDLSKNATDKILKNGVNNSNPNSYQLPQETVQNGTGTPQINPVTDFNNQVQGQINTYNNSDITPQTTPDPVGPGDSNPQYPENPPSDTTGDSGNTPAPSGLADITVSGLVSIYNPTKVQITLFSGWLWSSNFFDNFMKIFQNPMDAIIALHVIYATPISSGSQNIAVGYLDSGVSSKVVTQQFSEIDCGTVEIPEWYGNAIDYEPYTQVHVYLPFIGIVSIKPNDVIGKQLNIKYGIDALTGTCLATLTTIKGSSRIVCYTFAGNCAVQLPISGGNYAQVITSLAGFLASGVGAVATGNPIMALGAGASLLNTHLDVAHSGAIGSNAGVMGIRKPYVIITRKVAYESSGYYNFYGFPANKTTQLGVCTGYTRVKSVHIDSIIRATDNEKREIETLLKEGVIIE